MDKQRVKGALDKIKGSVKDAVGEATGNKRMQVEGKLDKTKGVVRTAVGDAKDSVRKAGRADKP